MQFFVHALSNRGCLQTADNRAFKNYVLPITVDDNGSKTECGLKAYRSI